MMLQLAYIGLTLLMTLILGWFGFTAVNRTFEPEKRGKKKTLIVTGLILHQVYIYLVAQSGILQSYSFPPRFVIAMILPAFIFTGIFVYKNRNSEWILNIPKQWLFFYNSFRILVESIFVASVTAGILHVEATINGYNYDMAYAFTIPVVGFLIFKMKALPLKVALYWNYLGLLVIASIIFVFQTTIYAPEMYGSTEPLMPLDAITYPYVLVAGFLMPSAVFIHVLSVAQLRRLVK